MVEDEEAPFLCPKMYVRIYQAATKLQICTKSSHIKLTFMHSSEPSERRQSVDT